MLVLLLVSPSGRDLELGGSSRGRHRRGRDGVGPPGSCRLLLPCRHLAVVSFMKTTERLLHYHHQYDGSLADIDEDNGGGNRAVVIITLPPPV